MKRIALLSLAIAATLHADTLPLSQDQIAALTPIDTLPSTQALDLTLVPDAMAKLVDIAMSADPTLDLGAQLRAIRTLPKYCPCTEASAPYATLVYLLQNYPSAPTPHDVLRLRAAIEAYSAIDSNGFPDGTNNYKNLVPFLSNSSRDIRAAAATALGKLCNINASQDLKTRSDAENASGGSQQVVLAISAALRDLANCEVSK